MTDKRENARESDDKEEEEVLAEEPSRAKKRWSPPYKSAAYAAHCFVQNTVTEEVKPYWPGYSIAHDHEFAVCIDEWNATFGEALQEVEARCAHPGNPLFVVTGSDGMDYVVTDKHGILGIKDERALKAAKDVLSDMGDGLKGIPVDYLSSNILLPCEGEKGPTFAADDFEKAFEQYRGREYMSRFLSKKKGEEDEEEEEEKAEEEEEAKVKKTADKKATTADGGANNDSSFSSSSSSSSSPSSKSSHHRTIRRLVHRVMQSKFVVEYIRERWGWYETSHRSGTNFRLTTREVKDMCLVDARELSGLSADVYSPLFVREIVAPSIASNYRNASTLNIDAQVSYGPGKFFNRRTLKEEMFVEGARFCEFKEGRKERQEMMIKGFLRASHMRFCGNYILGEEDKEERRAAAAERARRTREWMERQNMPVYGSSGSASSGGGGNYQDGSETLVKSGTVEQESVARFVLCLNSHRQHLVACPLMLELAQMKSVLVLVASIASVLARAFVAPQCEKHDARNSFEENAVAVLQELAMTLHPCPAWWKKGTICRGRNLKAKSFNLFAFRPSPMATDLREVFKMLKLDETPEHADKYESLKAALPPSKHYLFLPVVDMRFLYYPEKDARFYTFNATQILREKKVREYFDDAPEAGHAKTMVSAPVRLNFCQFNNGCRMNLLLKEPSFATKVPPIQLFDPDGFQDDDQAEELGSDHPEMVQFFADAIRRRCNDGGSENNPVDDAAAVEDLMERQGIPDEAKELVKQRLAMLHSASLSNNAVGPIAAAVAVPAATAAAAAAATEAADPHRRGTLKREMKQEEEEEKEEEQEHEEQKELDDAPETIVIDEGRDDEKVVRATANRSSKKRLKKK